MEYTLNKQSFKLQAKNQHSALKSRGILCKLSDIQESLAKAYGFENLATLNAKFKESAYAYVDAKGLDKQLSNLFVITWQFDPEDKTGLLDEEMAIYPPMTTLANLASSDYLAVRALNDKALFIPEGMVFSKETVALENYALVPNISKYGLGDFQNERTVSKSVIDYLGFRVPPTGIPVHLSDLGDDSGSKDHFLIWLNDEDSAKVRLLFVGNSEKTI